MWWLLRYAGIFILVAIGLCMLGVLIWYLVDTCVRHSLKTSDSSLQWRPYENKIKDLRNLKEDDPITLEDIRSADQQFWMTFHEKKHVRKATEKIISSDLIQDENQRGLQVMSEKHVLILGCTRNLEHIINATCSRFRDIGKMFKSYNVFIYDNSNDGTTDVLQKWKEDEADIFDFVSEPMDPQLEARLLADRKTKDTPRFIKMQYVRERMKTLWHQKQTREGLPDPDYIILYDTDMIIGPDISFIPLLFSPDAPEWSGVFPHGICYGFMTSAFVSFWTGRLGYYDVGAYEGLSGHRPGARSLKSLRRLFGKEEDAQSPEDGFLGWQPVRSAFGGVGIYKYAVWSQSTYMAAPHPDAKEHNTVEHLVLNRNIGQDPTQPPMWIVPYWYSCR